MPTWSGSYGQPIVMGLTPFNRTRVRVPSSTKLWPPDEDAERLDRYVEYEALIENRPHDVFERAALREDQKSKILLAVALPELLCNVWADSVWGDPPEIELPSTSVEDRWAAIDDANGWSDGRAWESVFAASFRGTSVVRLFRSEALGDLTGHPVQIEEISSGIYFPKLRSGSDRLIEYVVLAWEENRPKDDGRDEIWQVREMHEVSSISGKYEITRSERKGGKEDFSRVSSEQTTLDFLPFIDMHGARWSGRYWGVSELSRCMTLFDDVDNTLSNVSNILEYHGDPMLQIPASTMFGGTLFKGSDKAIGIRDPKEADVARYITFEGMLDQHLADLDKVIDLIMLTSEVPLSYFGRGVGGELGSGTAMRLQLQNYLKKAARWQRREAARERRIIDFGLRIDGVTDEAQRKAKVTSGSPLPADDEQEARIEQGLFGAGMSSLELSLRKLRRVPAEELDDELARIADEKAASVQAAQDAFGGGAPAEEDDDAPPPPGGRQGPPQTRRGGSSAQRQA